MSAATSKRRQGPLRQLSLQSPQHVTSRGPLRKQLSEDGSQSNHLIPCWSDGKDVTSLRVAANSAKTSGSHLQDNKRQVIVGRTGGSHNGRARPIKVAWAEVKQPSQELGSSGVEVIARKCSGQPRPATAKPHHKPHLPSIGDKDTILYSRQQLAERLRKVWKEREQSRNNIDIFLANNSADSGVCEDESTLESETPIPNKAFLKTDETFDVEVGRQSSRSVVATVLESKPDIQPHYPQRKDTTTTLLSGDTLRPSNNVQIIKQSSNETLFTTLSNRSLQAKSLSEKKANTLKDRNSIKQIVCKDVQEDDNSALNASVKYETLSEKNTIRFLGPEHTTLQQKANVNFVHSVFSVTSNASVIPSGKMVENETQICQNVYSSSPKLSLGGRNYGEDAIKYDDMLCEVSDESMVVDGSVQTSQEIEEINVDVDTIIEMEVSTSESQSLSLSSQDSTSIESYLPQTDATGEDLSSKSDVTDKVEVELTKPTIINATARRVIFRNSVNKAITSSFSSDTLSTSQKETQTREKPAPLCRALSAPPQKFVPNTRSILVRKPPLQTSFSVEYDVKADTSIPCRLERQTKSAPPRRPKLKTTRRRGKSRDDDASDDEDQQAQEKPATTKGRKTLVKGAEVVTMVSLMSPNGSENEEDAESSEFLPTSVDHIAPWFEEKNDGRNDGQKSRPTDVTPSAPRIVCLRKSPKTVSFQNQPSLSGGRSYSTLFPVRRGSVMGSSLSPTTVISPPHPIERERRLEGLDTLASRRRLVRTRSFPVQEPTVESATDPSDAEPSSVGPNMAEVADVTPSRAPPESAEDTSRTTDTLNTEETSEEPVFQNPKEKECWKLYKKMSEKGVSVSYETVLRGMLTPTEYRLRKKALLNISCS